MKLLSIGGHTPMAKNTRTVRRKNNKNGYEHPKPQLKGTIKPSSNNIYLSA